MVNNYEYENFYNPALDPRFNKPNENMNPQNKMPENVEAAHEEKHPFKDLPKIPHEMCQVCMHYCPMLEGLMGHMHPHEMHPGMSQGTMYDGQHFQPRFDGADESFEDLTREDHYSYDHNQYYPRPYYPYYQHYYPYQRPYYPYYPRPQYTPYVFPFIF